MCVLCVCAVCVCCVCVCVVCLCISVKGGLVLRQKRPNFSAKETSHTRKRDLTKRKRDLLLRHTSPTSERAALRERYVLPWPGHPSSSSTRGSRSSLPSLKPRGFENQPERALLNMERDNLSPTMAYLQRSRVQGLRFRV